MSEPETAAEPETEPAKAERAAEGLRPVSEMRLRSGPPPVARLSRKVLVGLGLVGAAGVGAALVLALRPQTHTARPELLNPARPAPPEGLATLPSSYAAASGTVPKLGPPLPGDLGRPILEAGAPAPALSAPATSAPAAPSPSPEAQQAQAALSSQLFSQTGVGQMVQAAAQPLAAAAEPAPAATPASAPATDHRLAFLAAGADRAVVSPDPEAAPASPYLVQAGTVIPAALITGIRSDLPGEVTAQVTEDVFDSPTGKILLIPQGARLVGQYDAQVSFGQSRALLAWTRLIFPDGRSVVLDRQPAADAQGFAGLQDGVDQHWGSIFKAAAISTLLSVGAEAGTSDNENALAQAIRQGAAQSFNQAGEQIVGRSLNVAPTLTIRPGFPVRVMLTKDLALEPYRR
jgi:type IV secretion system protein VirB10